jgi:small subunit ribosomal protein S17
MADKEQELEAEQATAVADTGEPTVEPDSGGATRKRPSRKTRVGVVTSDRADKTVTVTVERTFAHPLYGKRVVRTKKYHAHDETNEHKIGDVVRIAETRPLSRTKRWRVVELIERPA